MSRIRFGNLSAAFGFGQSRLLSKIAQISVIYEDLRIETTNLSRASELLKEEGTNAIKTFEVLYYLRRSLVSLIEYSSALNEVHRTPEFKRQSEFLQSNDARYIADSNNYLQSNKETLKKYRNDFGGHFKSAYAEYATANFPPNEVGKIEWDTKDGHWALKLDFAASIIASGLEHTLQPSLDWTVKFRTAIEAVGMAYHHCHGCTVALVHAFLWDRFR